MSVAIPVTTPPAASPQLPTLWELGTDLQAETSWIARLSERLDTEDDDERALAIADLEESLALEDNKREAFLRKADATCWVIERLRAEANYHSSQSKRFSALAKREDNRADALESTLIHLLSRLDPSATAHNLLDHRLTSRTTEAIEIDDAGLLPPDLLTTQTTTTPNKTSIKARIRSVISSAISGLPKPEAAHLAFSLSATAVPGARLIKRRHWSIT
ncbi:siphovirus Gp157 family protein [Vulcanococcus sp. Clear-D1]|uniref:siphovirus Gp157 family protein n=1 Tax=Vulcanococcus sp. Clear-D1 TaxID=2766970 RepID=UPI0019B96A30|nr:siphovirus Gp157 family protein [Vulcanococcus sp. Clear-D1]MBD1194516.1 siphovirus Gp157 family protein [Vulcanococcus sp. Clear-D1]